MCQESAKTCHGSHSSTNANKTQNGQISIGADCQQFQLETDPKTTKYLLAHIFNQDRLITTVVDVEPGRFAELKNWAKPFPTLSLSLSLLPCLKKITGSLPLESSPPSPLSPLMHASPLLSPVSSTDRPSRDPDLWLQHQEELRLSSYRVRVSKWSCFLPWCGLRR